MILYQWYYIFQASKVCVFVTRGRHFGAQESVWSYFFEEKPRKILVKLTQGPQNHSRGQVTKIVLNKIILNVWIENGPVLLYGPGIELAFRSNSYYYLSFPREYFGQIKTSKTSKIKTELLFVLFWKNGGKIQIDWRILKWYGKSPATSEAGSKGVQFCCFGWPPKKIVLFFKFCGFFVHRVNRYKANIYACIC
jgi:hypothetical protein